jgi:acyl-CoA reductase-like NAD-dependent aldehyde dehydrogenase
VLDQLVIGDALDPATTLGPIVSRRQLAVVRRMRTGTVTVNTSIDFDFDFDFDAPYGGFKSSGTERGLGGIEGILGFTEARAIGL